MKPYPIHQQGALLAVYYRQWLAPGRDFEPLSVVSEGKADLLKAMRLELFLTQAELGAKLGLTGRQVRRLESGETPVKPHHLLAVEALLRQQYERIRDAAAAMMVAGMEDE